ncbi:hypothetical protein IU438_14900 [Nocardia cyriacigeorgica]|uniref:Uncharacterized protein n=1 Tax=Nocardia cyriacigeorgica TaxID=135487 RepID=A0A2L2JN00_9NOCA|nr:hypothetical protein [Nocardia cyriacigeorgica]AVH21203.1 hypothetical protein C5B73_06700 [Nocardia cyriacigeorgica]MBF6087570.1 hypothetical protein [Nocardia cyriacigeorgica]MBF6092500.1 hypothetical protein [Nocardia cyriacigeorgica]MBF6101989.1 hypothetical protein [Nocardia cyriacigeorgica]MBF6160264.1 hypothetical protein [Nocardia cyriacigeorgica]
MVLFPVALMLFALGMERVENRLRKLLEPDEEVQLYLDKASNAEVKELTKLGLPAAVARMRRRRSRAEEMDIARAS